MYHALQRLRERFDPGATPADVRHILKTIQNGDAIYIDCLEPKRERW